MTRTTMAQEHYTAESLTGKMAFSKAGHDQGKLFVIVGEEADTVRLADGKSRTAAFPKRKNKKHIQPVLHLPAEVTALLYDLKRQPEPDVSIRKAIKSYEKGLQEQAGDQS